MCLEPSVTGFYRVSQKVSDVIPVLRLTPIGTQPSAVSLASPSAVHCGRICRAQTCAHSGVEPSTLAKGFLQDGPKVRQKFEFLTIFSLQLPDTKGAADRSQNCMGIQKYTFCGTTVSDPLPKSVKNSFLAQHITEVDFSLR